ncbi:type II secretion system protein [Planctomycetaceae bacterium SH139]
MISFLTPNRRRPVRDGFTLVEIMVTLVVISILAGMTMVGIESARGTARHAATRGLVARINEVILANWDEYHYRVLPVQFDIATIMTSYDPTSGETLPQLLPEEAGRVRLMMLRDLMRMELPDRKSDLFLVNGDRTGATNVRAIGLIYDVDMQPMTEQSLPIAWPPSARLRSYQNKVIRIYDTNSDGSLDAGELAGWTPQNESAECLFLVLSSITSNGIAALDVIAPYQIDDTDGDGMNEIVDSWRNPISWIRWPAGSPSKAIRRDAADEFDLLSSDWGAQLPNVAIAYSLIPQVVSAGPDGELGLITTQFPDTAYHVMQWPSSATTSTIGNHAYIDPYDRLRTGGISGIAAQYTELPGAFLSADRTFAADNISSFDL